MRDALIAAMQATAAEPPRAVTVPKWGTVYVRSLTLEEVERQTPDEGDGKSRLAKGVARVLCDESGKPLFSESNPDDVALLAKQPWKLLRKVLAAADEDDSGN